MQKQPKQSLAEAIRDIRTNLRFNAEYLRQFDEEQTEQIAKRLDRLRCDLKRYQADGSKKFGTRVPEEVGYFSPNPARQE